MEKQKENELRAHLNEARWKAKALYDLVNKDNKPACTNGPTELARWIIQEIDQALSVLSR